MVTRIREPEPDPDNPRPDLTPARICQALNDSIPRHAADIVCNRDGLEWFSCREHAPKDVKAMSLPDWWRKCLTPHDAKRKADR